MFLYTLENGVRKHKFVQYVLPEIEPIESLRRVSKGIGANLLLKPWKQTPPEQRRMSLSEITGGEVAIEILYDSEPVRQALRESLLKVLGFNNTIVKGNTYRSPQLNLHLIETPIGELGGKLGVEKGKKNAIQEAIDERINQVEQRLRHLSLQIA